MKTKTTEELIVEKIRDRFIEKYPNVYQNFKKHMECFVSWIVQETLKEVNDES